MTKRILSVVLVLAVFFGGYTILPKKFNPIPVNDVNAATIFQPGYYMCKKTCVTVTLNTTNQACSANTPVYVVSSKAYNVGELVYINRSGYDGKNFVSPYVKNYFVPIILIDRG